MGLTFLTAFFTFLSLINSVLSRETGSQVILLECLKHSFMKSFCSDLFPIAIYTDLKLRFCVGFIFIFPLFIITKPKKKFFAFYDNIITMEKLEKFFNFKGLNTNFQTEVLAGVSAFFAMSYILVIGPKMLEIIGLDFGASLTSMIIAAFLSCLFMGLYAKRPFGLAPYIGEIAFMTYTVVLLLGYRATQVLGAIFICGVILLLMTIFNIRPKLVKAIPMSLKYAFSAGFGMFLVGLGLMNTKILTLGDSSLLIHIGNLSSKTSILTLLGIFLIAVLSALKIKGSVLISIVSITVLAFLVREVSLPSQIFSTPGSIMPILGHLDILGVLNFKAFPLLFIMFIVMFVDTMGALIALTNRTGQVNYDSEIERLKKPMLVDSVSTIISSFMGSVTTGVYLESAVGVESGGKSGLTPIVTGLLFLSGLFLTPLLTSIPPCAYSPAVIYVGILMISSISKIDFEDITEWFPSIITILFIGFSFNIGMGMSIGFITYPLLKLCSKRREETNATHWILAIASVVLLIVYPYK